ncbi:MAG: hypothetical protein RR415_12885 [Ruthenibacterium sp.]
MGNFRGRKFYFWRTLIQQKTRFQPVGIHIVQMDNDTVFEQCGFSNFKGQQHVFLMDTDGNHATINQSSQEYLLLPQQLTDCQLDGVAENG